jgi:hypothetical protein
MGKLDEKEKSIALSPAEERRQANFEKIAAGLEEKGYKRNDLTIGIIKANVLTFLISLPIIIVAFILFFIVNPNYGVRNSIMASSPLALPIFLILLFPLIALHELIHGLTWSFFCENGFKDIEFGVKWKLLTPYCVCKTPLKKGHYILGALMPLIVLGLIPSLLAMAIGSMDIFLLGLVMILSAGGDILIVLMLLKYKAASRDVIIFDHPSQAGSIVFER